MHTALGARGRADVLEPVLGVALDRIRARCDEHVLGELSQHTGTSKMPGKGRPFTKGVSGNPGGRPKVLGDVQELARQKSPEAIETLSKILLDEKAAPAARVAAANALLDRGYGKPTQPISQTLAKVDPSTMSDEELAAIAMGGTPINAQAH